MYLGARPLRDLKTMRLVGYHAEQLRCICVIARESLNSHCTILEFLKFVTALVFCHSFPKQHCNSRNAAESRL